MGTVRGRVDALVAQAIATGNAIDFPPPLVEILQVLADSADHPLLVVPESDLVPSKQELSDRMAALGAELHAKVDTVLTAAGDRYHAALGDLEQIIAGLRKVQG